MSSSDLLSRNVLKSISNKGWEKLTDIQELTIPFVVESDYDLIIEANTASGKTEAVFLPIISELDKRKNYYDKLEVLYISPLRALINDQFYRLTGLMKDMGIDVTKWHSDVSQSYKNSFVKNPRGILQITPESIESILINRSDEAVKIFENIKYIVIDEVHYFVGEDRGYHLQSLIYRIKRLTNSNPRVFALSATISDYEGLKRWINPNVDKVKVISSKNSVDDYYLNVSCYNGNDYNEFIEVCRDIINLTKNHNALIFCDQIGKVEQVVYELNKLYGDIKYYPHHSNICKNKREQLEERLKNKENISVVCTSTLELGVDIGDLDLIIEFDGINNVSSLKQRIGRSGRRKNRAKICQIYCSSRIRLLETYSALDLLKKGVVESKKITKLNYDYLFQQLLSVVMQNGSINLNNLLSEINQNPVFSEIPKKRLADFVRYMISKNYLIVLDNNVEVTIGYAAESIVSSMDFYTMFEAPNLYDVVYKGEIVGYLNPNVLIFDKIFNLNGKCWNAIKVVDKTRKIFVEPSTESNYASGEGGVEASDLIRMNIPYVLINQLHFNCATEHCREVIDDIYNSYSGCLNDEFTVIVDHSTSNYFYYFCTSQAIKNTIYYCLRKYGLEVKYFRNYIQVKERIDIDMLRAIVKDNCRKINITDFNLENTFSKYSSVLSNDFLNELYAERYLDAEGAENYIDSINLSFV